MANPDKSPEDPVFQSLSLTDQRLIKEFMQVSSHVETKGKAIEKHLMVALNFALARRVRAS